MSLRIVIDGVDIPYQKETLKLREDNNAFSTKLKAVHNEYPFLILKEPHILELLKIDRLQTTGKRVVTPCHVVQDNIVYTGRLILIEVFTNTIKADLVYESALMEIMEESIKDFMPTLSAVMDGPPGAEYTPYTEEVDFLIDNHYWRDFSAKDYAQTFPNKDYCFPLQKFAARYEAIEEFPEGLEIVNQTLLDSPIIMQNTFVEVDDDTVEVYNSNLLYPSVFLLAPLKNALKSIGYTLTGSFVNHEIIKKTFMFSKEHQMTKFAGFSKETVVNFLHPEIPYEYVEDFDREVKKYEYVIGETGTFVIHGLIARPEGAGKPNAFFTQRGAGLSKFISNGLNQDPIWFYEISRLFYYDDANNTIDGEYTFVAGDAQIGETLTFYFVPRENREFQTAQLTITKRKTDATLYTFHPIMELARFVPDWTVAKMINSLTNWRNISVRVDDVKKQVVMDYNEELLMSGDVVDLASFDFKINSFSPDSTSAFVLKGKNESDPKIIYNSTGMLESKAQDQYTEIIENEFKQVPVRYPYALLSEEYEELDGIGLGIYSADGRPSVIEGDFGDTHRLDGPGGVFETNWKKWLKFRVSASAVQVTGALSLAQINELSRKKKVYLNQQSWLIRSIQYQEGRNEYQVTLDLESINF